eukprot:TRINITY_DN15819_c0_g1_i1.p1 TRINITY_DN15819_c0_g1~~TRINITY_DN15819_c0_g1_i1.p1  ORF type:complete len:124 (-),score=27.82 TRINITY_DN15819_c0_g1_i1:183-554(-)
MKGQRRNSSLMVCLMLGALAGSLNFVGQPSPSAARELARQADGPEQGGGPSSYNSAASKAWMENWKREMGEYEKELERKRAEDAKDMPELEEQSQKAVLGLFGFLVLGTVLTLGRSAIFGGGS